MNTMEIDDANLRQFERIARKYGVDYAVRRDTYGRCRRASSCSSKAVMPTQSWRRSRSSRAPKSAKSERPSLLQKLRDIVPVVGAPKERHKELER